MKHLAIGLLLSGVALFSFATGHYPPEAHSTRTTVTVNVVWLPDFRMVDLVCAYLSHEKPEGRIKGCFDPMTTTIYAVEPSSFNDMRLLGILGHEFWHSLGAMHPALSTAN